MKGKNNFKTVDILFALVLFVIFAVAVLMVLLSGARIYRDSVDSMAAQYEERTSISYIVTKLRGHDATGRISIGSVDDSDALFMSEEIDGVIYETVIYLHEGKIMEYFGVHDPNFHPSFGSVILEAKALTFEKDDDGFIRIAYETDDGLFEARVGFRSKGAVR